MTYGKRFYIILLIAILSLGNQIYSQNTDFDSETIKKDLPLLLGSNSAGTRFLLTFHPCWELDDWGNEIKIYAVSDRVTNVTLHIEALGYSSIKTAQPNEVIEFGLSPSTAQMYTKDDSDAPKPQTVYQGRALEIISDEPIICYGMTRYRYSSDGFMILPIEQWGTDYVVSSWNDPGTDDGSQYLTSYTSIVAGYDNTKVKFKLGGSQSNYTPGVNRLAFGDSATKKMNSNDVWLIGVAGDYNDLSGSLVHSNKPVAVISGNFCAYVPTNVPYCDYIISQDRPIDSWGKQYHVTPIINRKNGSIVRVYTSEPTTVYQDDKVWGKLSEVGGSEGSGFISRRIVDEEDELRPVLIHADAPITVTQYNTGQAEDKLKGDPFQATLNPISDYSNEFYFAIPVRNNKVGFEKNYINIIYQATDNGEIPNDIELGIRKNGNMNWQKLNTIAKTSGKDIYNKGDIKWKVVTVRLTDSEALYYGLRGNKPMGVLQYGYDYYESYGYSVLGVNTYNNTIDDNISPKILYSSAGCGKYVGTVLDVAKNESSKLKYIKMINDKSNNYKFTVQDDFIPGFSAKCDWFLDIISKEKDAKAHLYFSDKAGNDTSYIIEYFPPKLKADSLVHFSKLMLDESIKYDTLIITNKSNKAILIDSITLKKPTYGFRILNENYDYPIEIQEDDSLRIVIEFNKLDVEELIKNGRTEFSSEVVVKAQYDTDCDCYCYDKNISTVRIEIEHISASPVLLNPVNGSTNVPHNNARLDWEKDDKILLYTVQLTKDSTFATINFEEETQSSTHNFGELEYSQKYFWRVRGKDSDNNKTDWSDVWEFTTEDDVSVKDELEYLDNLVYPNPAQNTITINRELGSSVKIYDINGKLVITANTKKIDISELPTGKYLIIIIDNDVKMQGEFIKQ